MAQPTDKLLLAQSQLQMGKLDDAKATLMRALPRASGPLAADMSRLLSQILVQSNQRDQALHYAERAVAGAPANPDNRVHLANVLWAMGRSEDAVRTVREAVSGKTPPSRNAHGLLVNFLLRDDRFADALEACEAALALFPGDVEFVSMRATMLLSVGRPEAAVAELKAARTRDPGNLRVLGALGPAMNYAPDVPAADSLAVHKSYGAALAAALPPGAARTTHATRRPGAEDPNRPLRLGIVSPDLRNHAMQHFIEPVLAHLDRAAFSTYCYFVAGAEDEVSLRLKSLAAHWKHVPTLHAGQLAELIQKDGIDILIDLAGHTRFNRLATMALKPAPIIANYIGYPHTTGLAAMDYNICDSRCVPDDPPNHWTERPLVIDPVYFCYQPPAASVVPDLAPAPCEKNGFVTFGSFNTLMKLNDRVVNAWARIVNAVPRSRLILKNIQLSQEQARRLTSERLIAAGIPADRFEVVGHHGTMSDHLATYARIDIALDTFPYAGMTTTCESLLMGVPVVTLAQHTMPSRVGRSILDNVGLPELVATTEDQFVSIASQLAGDVSRLHAWRPALRVRLLESVVCDAPGYGARFGASLRSAWQRWCASERNP